jgi:tetratricopeptide (TPR) repeat protein
MNNRMIQLACVMTIGLMTTGLRAQVRQVGADGRALDASYQVGSGGRNYAVPNNYAPASTSIYGSTRTRGLSSFRGAAPALSGDFQGTLGSDGLSRFERQSVGIQDVLRGGTYNPASDMYYDPYRRTLTPQNINRAAEYNIAPVPGEVSRTLRVAQELFVDATAAYAPVMQQEDPAFRMGQLLDISPPRDAPPSPADRYPALDAMYRASQEGPEMFGVLRSDDRARLAEELRELRDGRRDERDAETDPRQRPLELQVQPEGAETVGRPLGDTLRGPQRPEPLKRPGEEDPAEELANRTIRTRRGGDESLPAADQDVFLDVLVALRERQAMEDPDSLPSAEDKGREILTAEGQIDLSTDPALRVERTKDNRVVIHRLEGTRPSSFNDLMTQGRQALRQGRFYRASRQYDLASMVRPRNPLPLVGRGLSGFAAGEYYTAALAFRRALEVFPALMETQLDFDSLLPMAGFDMDVQMHQLEQWLADVQADPAVRFLAIFLYHNMGKNELARHHAEQFTVLYGENEDPIFSAYVQFILTGKKPAELTDDQTLPEDDTSSGTFDGDASDGASESPAMPAMPTMPDTEE